VDSRNVHAYVLGEHGDSEFPVWSRAMIGGAPLDDYCPTCGKNRTCGHLADLEGIFREVRDTAYRIIDKKGETSYGIGLALVRITAALLGNENSVLPVSSLHTDLAGKREIYLSLPAVVNRRGIRQVVDFKLEPDEEAALEKSAGVIAGALEEAGI
jgi:L-lactate dehydrogenase